jgi:rubrerythrin
MPRLKIMSAFYAGLLAATACVAQEIAPAKSITLDNLQAAYNGESNAKGRYEAFAVKADEEGYKGVASLFRAAAASEGVHLQGHAEDIKSMGAEPMAHIKGPEVKSTHENLEAALKGETYEM